MTINSELLRERAELLNAYAEIVEWLEDRRKWYIDEVSGEVLEGIYNTSRLNAINDIIADIMMKKIK